MAILADTSVWAWAKRSAPLAEKLRERLGAGEIATCGPVALEVLHSSRDGTEYEADRSFLTPLRWLPLASDVSERALEIQRSLAHTMHGAHRIPAIDYLVAAVAERAETSVWHLDADLARICEFIGHPHEHERLPRRAR